MIFAGSILLCSLGITIVVPYQETKSWAKVECRITEIWYNNTICTCDQQLISKDCMDTYPCLQVRVAFRNQQISRANDNANGSSIGDTSTKSYRYNRQLSAKDTDPSQVMAATVNTESEATALLFKSWSDAFYQTVRC